MILRATHVNKSYCRGGEGTVINVIRDLDLEIHRGETLAVTGPSGCGKTTLLALLAGLDAPDSGRIILNGRDLGDMNEDGLAKFRARNIGIIFQQFYLMPHLTAEENIRLPLEILKSGLIEEKTHRVLKQVGLYPRRDHYPSQLSGGECQRVAIGRALAVEPSLLLADEPTGNLDVATGGIVAELLFDLVRSRDMTLVLVTHNPSLARRCDRVLRLEDGGFRL